MKKARDTIISLELTPANNRAVVSKGDNGVKMQDASLLAMVALSSVRT